MPRTRPSPGDLRSERDAFAERLFRRARGKRFVAPGNSAGGRPVGAEDAACDFTAAADERLYMPTISPAPTLNDTSAKAPARARPCTLRRCRGACGARCEKGSRSRGRPSCGSARPCRSARSAMSPPARRRAARSRARRARKSRRGGGRCRSPRCRDRAAGARRRTGARYPVASVAVGSSRMSTRGSMEIALAISMICRCAADNAPVRCRTSSSGQPSSPNKVAARRCAARQSIQPVRGARGRWPSRTFSVTLRLAPACRAGAPSGFPGAVRRAAYGSSCAAPSTWMWPASTPVAPVRTRVSVLLPAPFSPTMAWISPARNAIVTPRRACVPP